MPGETKLDDPQRERLAYTYTYTSNGDNNENPQTNTVQVITTVEEETTPDGTKVVRKKEEAQQLSKITKVEKFTRTHRHLIDPLTGEIIKQNDPKYQTLIDQYGHTPIKHETSGGFSPSSSYSQYDNETKTLTNGMKYIGIDDNHDDIYTKQQEFIQQSFNGSDYNEPENNKSIVLYFICFVLFSLFFFFFFVFENCISEYR